MTGVIPTTTEARVSELIAAAVAGINAPQFVQAGSMTVDQLLTNFPAGATYRGKYARVSDYGGYVDRVVRCDFDSDLNYHFWTPTQPEYGRSIAVTGNMTLMALKSPPSINFTGSIALGVTRNVTIDLTNRRPGEILEFKGGLTSLLGGLNILGTGLGSGLSILLGGYSKILIDGSGGSLQMVRLV